MEISTKKISDLIPASYNPRKISEKNLEALRNSIDEFGYVEPIIWNKQTKHVVGGHQRLKALEMLGTEDVECVIVDMSEAKEKALNIALNKISGKWDMDKLELVFEDLKLEDIDLSLTGFELEKIDNEFEEKYFGDEVERTFNSYRLNDYDETRTSGYYNIPTLQPSHVIPDKLVGFNYIKSIKEIPKNCGVHFFIDDYQFERIWNSPFKVIERLKKFNCVLTPDFSLYMDMPLAMKIWNVYRSHLVGQIMQDAGLTVIPTLQWAEEETFKFCFDGIEQGGVVAVSTVGVMNSKEAQEIWKLGMDMAIKKIQPECLICYGSRIDYDFAQIKVKYIEARKFK